MLSVLPTCVCVLQQRTYLYCRIMQENYQYLFQFDQLREGARLVQGDANYAQNPLKVQCMLGNDKCGGCRLLGKMNYPQDMFKHYRSSVHKVQAISMISESSMCMMCAYVCVSQDDPNAEILSKRWEYWHENRFTLHEPEDLDDACGAIPTQSNEYSTVFCLAS